MHINNIKIVVLSCLSILVLASLPFNNAPLEPHDESNIAEPLQPELIKNNLIYEKAISKIDLPPSNNFNKKLPSSLEGINTDIGLTVDTNGNLIVNMALKDLFEIYLSAIGEEELGDIVLRIQSALERQLTSPALEQGYEVLKRFIDYKIELANVKQQSIDPLLSELENTRHQKETLANIRQAYFTPDEFNTLFATEMEYDAFMLEHLTIQDSEHFSPYEKQQMSEDLVRALPENIRTIRENIMRSGHAYEQAKRMKAQGASTEEVYQMREKYLGSDAAIALAELDDKRERWKQRLDEFHIQYTTIIQSDMSVENKNTEINTLLARSFTDIERVRVRAINGLM